MIGNNVQENATETPDSNVLTEQEQAAIEMRYEGKEYAEIAAELKLSVSTVEKWFAPSYDRLHKAYLAYADDMNEKRKQIVERRLKGLLGKAIDAMDELVVMADKDSTRLAAAESIIDRGLGKAVQVVQFQGTELLERTGKQLDQLLGTNDNPTPS